MYTFRILLAIVFFLLFGYLLIRLGVPLLLVGAISYIPAVFVYVKLAFLLSSLEERLLKQKVKTRRNLLVHYFNLRKPFRQPFILYLRPFNFDHSGLNTLEEYVFYKTTDIASQPQYYYKGRPQYDDYKYYFDKTVINLLRPWGDTMALISNSDYEEENTIGTTDENWESMFAYLSKNAAFILCTPMHLVTLKNEMAKRETGFLKELSHWPGTDSTSYNGFVKELNFLYAEKLLHKTILAFPAFEFCQHYDAISRACREFNLVLPAKNNIKAMDMSYNLADMSDNFKKEFLRDAIVVIKTNHETEHEKKGILITQVFRQTQKKHRKILAAYLE